MPGARIAIEFCTRRQWLLRAAWMAQELVSVFGEGLDQVALAPRTGGVFRVLVGDTVIWDRAVDGDFPDIRTLKQRVRDSIHLARAETHL